MNRENLANYLNDHLAGSVAALELLDYLIKNTKDTVHEPFFMALRKEVALDQDVLRMILKQIGASESMTRKAGAWLMEKVARAKLRVDGPAGSVMGRMEVLEALLLGITGKRALWQVLELFFAPSEGFNFVSLARRAEQQIAAVESKRIEAAREAIG